MIIIKNLKLKIKNLDWILITILFVATILRLWNLGSVPPSLTSDEAALGYNAYSILKTGKDEYGKFLPIIFKSFGDYKPGLYVYLAVPFVAVSGLNEFAVRLPSAVFGIFSVLLIYLIVGRLFGRKIGLLSAFIASVTPWLIYFSRGAWEVNVSLALTLAGIYFFLRALDSSRFIVHSSLFFALTLIAYQGAKLSTGIVVLILLILYWKEMLKIDRKIVFSSLLLSFILVLPVIFSFFTGQTGRLNVFSVFSYPRSVEYIQSMLFEGGEKIGDVNYYFYHSESVNFVRGILGRYFNHFSGRFLFFEGDFANPRHSAPYQGMLLLTDLLLIVFGVFAFLKDKISKEKLFFILWLILAPLPAVLSRDQVHAVRSFNMVVPLIIILAFGLFEFSRWLNSHVARWLVFPILFTFYFLPFTYFLDAYFVHLPKHDSILWEYGYKQVVETVASIKDNYKNVKVQQSFAQPYIYFLFYEKYDPVKYQAQAKLSDSGYKGDVGYVTKLDNIEFAPIDWSVNRGESGTLFVADPVRIPPEDSKDPNLFNIIREIKYLNGRDTAFRIVEVK